MIRSDGDNLLIDILVQPRASKARFGPVHDERIKVAVTAPPVDGAANKAVCKLLAKAFNVAKSDVAVVAGLSSRRKTVRLSGVTRGHVDKLLT